MIDLRVGAEQVACDGGYAARPICGGEGAGSARHGLPQEEGPQGHGHGLVPAGLRAAEELPGREWRPWSRTSSAASASAAATGAGWNTSRAYVWSAVVTHNLWVIAPSQIEVEASVNRQRAASAAPACPGSAEPGGFVSPDSGEKATLTARHGGNPSHRPLYSPKPSSNPKKHRILCGIEPLRRQKTDGN